MGQSLLTAVAVRSAVLLLTAAAFFFGFPRAYAEYDLERLHIFLFNLCAGGLTIVLYSDPSTAVIRRGVLFFIFSIAYAVTAYFEQYFYSIASAFILFIIVESLRVSRFGFFPFSFFQTRGKTSEKFNSASLLCLSISLLLSGFVIINSEYLKLFSIPRLTLNVFFLGFSFPVSLITMSVMFSFIEESSNVRARLYEFIFFWVVNLGVILFFVFILLEAPAPEGTAAGILTLAVITVYFYFRKKGQEIQQKIFLQSGILFLLSTAVTGVIYIVMKFSTAGYDDYGKLILKAHAFLSLYGWNLSGLMVMLRWNDFPIKINTGVAVAAHWGIIAILAPLSWYGVIHPYIAPGAFTLFLALFFRGRSRAH